MSGPDVWGPHGWKFIHFITLGYPNNPSQDSKICYFEFFNKLSDVIPCIICKRHFKQNLERFPLNDKVLSDKLELIKWGINMHNSVNQDTGKPIYSHREGLNMIKNSQDKCYAESFNLDSFNSSNDNIYKNHMFYLMACIIIILLVVIYKLYKREIS